MQGRVVELITTVGNRSGPKRELTKSQELIHLRGRRGSIILWSSITLRSLNPSALPGLPLHQNVSYSHPKWQQQKTREQRVDNGQCAGAEWTMGRVLGRSGRWAVCWGEALSAQPRTAGCRGKG